MRNREDFAAIPVASKLKLFFQNREGIDITSNSMEIERSIAEVIGNIITDIGRVIEKVEVINWEAKAADPSMNNPKLKNYHFSVTAVIELSDHSAGLEQPNIQSVCTKIKQLVKKVTGIDLASIQFLAEAYVALPTDQKSQPSNGSTPERNELIVRS